MQRSLSLLYKMSVYDCPRRQNITVPQHLFGTILTFKQYSSKNPAQKKLLIHLQQQQGKESKKLKRLRDPIRSVSDILLRSLARRHKEIFPLQESQPDSISSLTPHFSNMSMQDLIFAVHACPRQEPKKTEHLKNIEQLLIKYLYKMPLCLMLQTCYGFYIQEYAFHQFLSQMLSVVDETFDLLSPLPWEVTHLFLFIFIHGNAPGMLLHRVEEYLFKNLDQFHINDLGVICAGFFRGNSRLSSQDLIDAIACKLLKEIDSLEPFLLLNFMKMFRHASFIRVSFYEKLGDKLVRNEFLSHYKSINPLMHIAFTYASIPIRHTELFASLFNNVEKILPQLSRIRTKDLSKFVWACATLQFRPVNYETKYQHLIQYFEASNNTRDFPESVAELLMGSVYLGIFPADLLHKCLSPEIASKLLESNAGKEKTIQLLLLNETMKLECPNSSGSLLPEGLKSFLMQHPSVSRDLKTELHTRVGLKVVLSSLQQSLGSDKVHCLHPLAHFKTAAIELHYSNEHGFISWTSPTAQQETSLLAQNITFTQRAITDHLYSALTVGASSQAAEPPENRPPKRLMIVVSSNNQYALNDNTHMLGHLHTMKRQLDKAGYTVLLIHPDDALYLELSSHEDRCNFLSEKLTSALGVNITLS